MLSIQPSTPSIHPFILSSTHQSPFVSFSHPFIRLSLKPVGITLAPTRYRGQREKKIWALPSRRAALQGDVGDTGEVMGVCAELHKAKDCPSWGTPLAGVGRKLPGSVGKDLGLGLRAEPPESACILSNFHNKPHSPGPWISGLQQSLPPGPHMPLPAPGPP